MQALKRYLFLTLLILLSVLADQVNSQDITKVDSLKTVLSGNISDSIRINTLNRLANLFHPKEPDSSIFYGNELMTFSIRVDNKQGMAKALLIEELHARSNKDYDKALQKAEAALALLENINAAQTMAAALIVQGKSYNAKKDYQAALEKFKRALEVAKQTEDIELIASSANQLAVQYYHHLHEHDKAIEVILPFENINESPGVTFKTQLAVYNSLASIYKRVGETDKAISYFHKAEEAAANTNDVQVQVALFHNIASLYRTSKRNPEAREQLLKALSIAEKQKFTKYNFDLYQGIGYTYYNDGQYEESLPYFTKVEKMAQKSGNTFTILRSSLSLAGVYYNLKRYPESKNVLVEAEKLSQGLEKSGRNQQMKMVIYDYLKTIDSAQNNFSGSFENYKKYIAIKDSLAAEKQKEKVANIELTYENEKKDKEIELLTAEKNIQKLLAEQQSSLKTGFIIGCVLLLLFLIAVFNRYQIKKRAVTTIEKQKVAIEEKNHENELLIQEIHHRVKNNLQIMLSLLNAQKIGVDDNQKAFDIIIESQNKIKSMALIHENLYNAESFTKIRTTNYFEDLINHIENSYSDSDRHVTITTNIEQNEIKMTLAVPLGLIVNELITNSYKYAFDSTTTNNTVTINFKKDKGSDKYKLEVFDNGNGLPEDFNLENTRTFGWQMIKGLTEQVDGSIEFRKGDGAGFDIYVKDVNINSAA